MLLPLKCYALHLPLLRTHHNHFLLPFHFPSSLLLLLSLQPLATTIDNPFIKSMFFFSLNKTKKKEPMTPNFFAPHRGGIGAPRRLAILPLDAYELEESWVFDEFR